MAIPYITQPSSEKKKKKKRHLLKVDGNYTENQKGAVFRDCVRNFQKLSPKEHVYHSPPPRSSDL